MLLGTFYLWFLVEVAEVEVALSTLAGGGGGGGGGEGMLPLFSSFCTSSLAARA